MGKGVRTNRCPGAALIAITAGLFLVVHVLSYFLARQEIASYTSLIGAASNEHIVPGGKNIRLHVVSDGPHTPLVTRRFRSASCPNAFSIRDM
jgi:hypothetical protein